MWGDKHSKQPQMKLLVGSYVSLKACAYTVPYPLFRARLVLPKRRGRVFMARPLILQNRVETLGKLSNELLTGGQVGKRPVGDKCCTRLKQLTNDAETVLL